MQDAQSPTAPYQSAALAPNSNALISRFVALLLDCFFLGFLIWVATHAFGTAQPGNNISVPGSLFGPGGVIYGGTINTSNGSITTPYWTIALGPFWLGLLVFLYFTLQEAFFGRTLGKAMMGLCVVLQLDETTYANLTLKTAILRNLLRFIDALGVYFVGGIAVLCSARRRRLGDMVAHTLVVKEASVPSIHPPRKFRTLGFQIVGALLLVFCLACGLFTYFGSAPLVVQNLLITQPDEFSTQPYSSMHVSTYALGQGTWGQDHGQATITYPVTYTAVYQNSDASTDQTQACQGSITLKWYWSSLDWELSGSGVSCTDA